ncbi:MAG: hypothetical protein SPK04_09855 [Succinivibrionaceae bacterium]|nr:hypothetical protein [Succinivibrionaceae bacterium]
MSSISIIIITIIAIGVFYLIGTFIFPSSNASKKLSQDAMRAVTDDPKFAKQKAQITRICNDKNLAEFMDFLKKYKGGKKVKRNGTTEQEFYPKEKNDLRVIFTDVIMPSRTVSVLAKENFRSYLISIGVEKIARGENNMNRAAPISSNESLIKSTINQNGAVENSATDTLENVVEIKPLDENQETTQSQIKLDSLNQVKEEKESEKSEELKLEESNTLAQSSESLNKNLDTVSLEEKTQEPKEEPKLTGNAALFSSVLAKKHVVNHEEEPKAQGEKPANSNETEFVFDPSALRKDEILNPKKDEKKEEESKASSFYKDFDASDLVFENHDTPASNLGNSNLNTATTDDFDENKQKAIKERSKQLVDEVFENLSHDKFKILENIKISFFGDEALFDYVIVGQSRVNFIVTKPFGLSSIEGGDDEAHIDINDKGEWVLKKNHTRQILVNPIDEMKSNQEIISPFIPQLGKVDISYIVLLSDGLLTYNEIKDDACEIVSINTIKEFIENENEEETLDSDIRSRILSKFDRFIKK